MKDNYQNNYQNDYDDGNIPEVDLPKVTEKQKDKYKNVIPDDVPRKDGPGGEGN